MMISEFQSLPRDEPASIEVGSRFVIEREGEEHEVNQGELLTYYEVVSIKELPNGISFEYVPRYEKAE